MSALAMPILVGPPIEVLVLLDHALENLPNGLSLKQWQGDEYKSPVLSSVRCIVGGESFICPTWTIEVVGLRFAMLEWWEDHWVGLMAPALGSGWTVFYEGPRMV